MCLPIFILLVLLTSSSKSAPNYDTPDASMAKSSTYNESEPLETLFIPEDPSRYEDILIRVRKLFEQTEQSEGVPEQNILPNSKENVKEQKEFSKISDARKRNDSNVTDRGQDEEKYLQRNSEVGVSLKTAAKINRDDYHNSSYKTKTEPDEEDVLEAANFGLDAMKELYTRKEPMLYSMGLYLDSDNPARHVAFFNDQTEEARALAKYGFAVLEGTTMFRRKFPDSPTNSFLSRRSQSNPLQRGCPNRGVPNCPAASLRYRTSDGSCNNLQHLWWGSAMSTMQRFLPAVYHDGIQSIRRSVTGRPLPSPRQVSVTIHEDKDIPLTSVTQMLMQWGQFIDHDITATGQSRGFNGSVPQCCLRFGSGFQPPEFMHPECLPIAVSLQDKFLGPLGVRCLEFVRSGSAPRDDCEFGSREQLSQVTSFLDASTVYSSSAVLSDSLRLFRNGLMQYGKIQSQRPQLPKLNADLCKRGSLSTSCFRAGDGRVGEQPALISLHVAFLRLHNRIATKLAALNAHWNDEKLFQESRRIVGAILQHITYREFLPIVLGQEVMKIFDLALLKKGYYEGYDPTVNPTIANAFSTAAYRFGHSLVHRSFVRFNSDHQPIFNNVSIHNEFTNPANLETAGSVDRLLLGLINQPSQRRDEHITEELTNHLFQTPNFPFGMDLASINIQRGRDHGIPPYVQWREPCGLPPIKNFEDLEAKMPPSTAQKFRLTYSSVEDIDLFTAGLAEKSVKGGLVGPTLACIIGQQFSNLRKGDRFWYENSGEETSFTPGQLQQIRRVSLAQVLCTTMDNIETIQPFVFLTHDTLKNQRLPCNDPLIGQLNLEFWAERSLKFGGRAGILDKLLRKTTPSPATTKKSFTTGQGNSGGNGAEKLSILSNITPPKASVHQINKIFLKKPLGPPDNYTIVVQNNAINSPVFVNDAIHGSSIKVKPTLNQPPQQRPAPQNNAAMPVFLPPPKPIPTTHPLEQGFLQRPYVPYSFDDPNNPNPLSQAFQSQYVTGDVLFESYPGTSPRPTLYTYYINFQRQTTHRPFQYHENRPSSWPQYQAEQFSGLNYNSPGHQQALNDHVYASKFEDYYQEGPRRPASNAHGQLSDSGNRYRPGNEYSALSNVQYDKINADNLQVSKPVYSRPAHADLDGWPPGLGYQKGSTDSNTVAYSSSRPILNSHVDRNSNNHYSKVPNSTPYSKLPQHDYYQTYEFTDQTPTPHSPSNIQRVTIVKETAMSQAGNEIDKVENRVTSEIPKPLQPVTGNAIVRKPGQYYYEKNVLHRYPDKVGTQKEAYNIEQRNKAVSSDGLMTDRSVIDASVRKHPVISEKENNTSYDAMDQTIDRETFDNTAVGDANKNLEVFFSEEIEADTNNSTNYWLNPQEDSSLESTMELPKIYTDNATAANELPSPMKFRNYAS